MNPLHLIIIVLSCLVAVAAVAAIAQFRSRLSAAKEEWLELATLLSNHGMPHSAAIFHALAVENLPKAFAECKYLLRVLRDPKKAVALLDGVFAAELPGALSDAARRATVAKLISDWITANPALAAAAGLAAIVPK